MILKRLSPALVCLLLMNGCVEPTAFIGPGVTVGTTGNIYQAGFSYGTNQIVKTATGSFPMEHAKNFIDGYKCETEFSCFVKNNVEKTKKIIDKHKGNLN